MNKDVMKHDWIKNHNLTLDIKKGYQTGILVGQVKEFKGVIVQGKNKEEVYNQANIALDGYFCAFPEEFDKLIKVN
jgi:predicted RNase H-like HicB family nuclease